MMEIFSWSDSGKIVYYNLEYFVLHCVATSLSITLRKLLHENNNGGGNQIKPT